MRSFLKLFGIVVLICSLSPANAESAITTNVRDIFERAEADFDIARVKFEIDQLIDPTVNVDQGLARIDQMVADIEAMLPRNADSWEKVETLQKFIYESGSLNNYRPFAYDMSDPLGETIQSVLMSKTMALHHLVPTTCAALKAMVDHIGWTRAELGASLTTAANFSTRR